MWRLALETTRPSRQYFKLMALPDQGCTKKLHALLRVKDCVFWHYLVAGPAPYGTESGPMTPVINYRSLLSYESILASMKCLDYAFPLVTLICRETPKRCWQCPEKRKKTSIHLVTICFLGVETRSNWSFGLYHSTWVSSDFIAYLYLQNPTQVPCTCSKNYSCIGTESANVSVSARLLRYSNSQDIGSVSSTEGK